MINSRWAGFWAALRKLKGVIASRSRCRADGVDRGLGAIEVLGCLGSIKQELEEALQVSFGCRRELNDKGHRPSRLRLASSLDCSLFRTVSTGTEAPVRWYSSDAA